MGSKHTNLVLRKTKFCEEPIPIVNHPIAILTIVCQSLPIETNQTMMHFLWMLIRGRKLYN